MKKRLFTTILISLFCIMLTACGSTVYESHNSDYVQETHVNGAIFDSPISVIDRATAVTMITNDMESGTYIYKDGESTYLLFDSDNIVLMAQKGTAFGFNSSSDYLTTLKEHGLNSIWFDEIDKKFDYKTSKSNGNFKIMMDVKADVSITADIYGIFAGKLAVLNVGDEEYSIFIGVPGDTFETVTKNQESIMEHVVASLDVNKNYVVQENAEDTQEDKSKTVDTETTEDTAPSEAIEEQSDENSTSEDSEDNDAVKSLEEIEIIEPEVDEGTDSSKHDSVEDTEEEPASEKSAEVTDETVSEEIAEDTTETASTEEKNEVDSSKKEDKANSDSEIVFSNQRADAQRASSLYNMKSVGEATTTAAMTFDSENYKIAVINLDNLMTGSEAESFLKKSLGSDYKTPDAGMSWNVIEYSLDISPEDGYVDIRLEGLDGGKLVSKGIAYSKRTYDIFDYITTNNSFNNKYYCYYQVPNGCKEYLIEIGMFGNNSEEMRKFNAYYKLEL